VGKHWVQAQTPFSRFDEMGALKKYQPGDWFEVRNQELLRLQAEGKVRTTREILGATFDFSRCGVLWRDDTPADGLTEQMREMATRGSRHSIAQLDEYGIAVKFSDSLSLPWEYTLVACAPVTVTAQNVALGFVRIEKTDDWENWEMAACLAPGLPLAQARGTDAERAATLKAIGDLRIPLYDVALVWVRKTKATQALIADWAKALSAGADEQHAFIRALYTRRVKMCTLPPGWVGASPGLL